MKLYIYLGIVFAVLVLFFEMSKKISIDLNIGIILIGLVFLLFLLMRTNR